MHSYIDVSVVMDPRLRGEGRDGGQHTHEVNIAKDQERSTCLEEAGFSVIRFWSNEVKDNFGGVLVVIKAVLQDWRFS